MSRSLNRQVLLLRLSAVSHHKGCFPVIYNSAKFSFVHDVSPEFLVWSSAKIAELFLRSRGTNPLCFSNIETAFCCRSSSVSILWSRTRTWHLEEWRPLCQANTLRKICLSPRSQVLSSYSSQLSKTSCFILGLSRSFSMVAERAALEPGLLLGLRARRLFCRRWVLPVDKQAEQASCPTQQAGPQPREASTRGKILKDRAGHRVRETRVGGWEDCDVQEGVAWEPIWSFVLTV